MGDVQCEILVVAPGALLQGKVAMKGLEGAENGGERRRTTKGARRNDEDESAEVAA